MSYTKKSIHKNINVIIVIYYPNESKLIELVVAVKSHVSSVIVVDNTPKILNTRLSNFFDNVGVIYIGLLENIGIAAAQNIGINYTINKTNSEYIVFLDQDTQVSNNFIKLIFNEYLRALDHNLGISVLSPVLRINNSNKCYKISEKALMYNFLKTDKVSSSGSFISVQSFKIVGLFDEELFIDYVDSEWCWRASLYNLNCFVTKNVEISHSIGNNSFYFLGLNFIISNNSRYFYQYRNWLKLLTRPYVPFTWKMKNSIKCVIFLVVVPFKFKEVLQVYKFIFKGIKEGIKIKL